MVKVAAGSRCAAGPHWCFRARSRFFFLGAMDVDVSVGLEIREEADAVAL